MFYTQNEFCVTITDYNAEAVLPSYAVYKKYFSPPATYEVTDWNLGVVALGVTGNPNWQNFVGWCKAIYDEDMIGFTQKETDTDEQLAVGTIIEAVMKQMLANAEWETVEGMLECFRRLMVIQDVRWAT